MSRRSRVEVDATLLVAKLVPEELLGTVHCLQFSPSVVSGEYSLLELDPALCERVQSGHSLVIRGDKNEHAVLCSDDKTYDLKIADTSNLLLFVPGCRTPEQLAADQETRNLIHAQISGFSNHYWELRRCRPKVKKLKKLLTENTYEGPDVERNKDSVNVTYTTEELLNQIQASEQELMDQLQVIHACKIDEQTSSQGRMKYLFVVAVFIVSLLVGCMGGKSEKYQSRRRTSKHVKEEIADYADIAQDIINLAVYGKAQNRSYDRLGLFVDTVGNRISGSRNLELAIGYMYKALQQDGLENVALEPVKVPHWVRGEESAMMLEPRNQSLAILGLGSSVGTPAEGITAEVLLVTSFEELRSRASEAKGKIVVYNQPYISYGETVQYRAFGAVEAAKVGAVASLIRSISPFSIYSPHTGWQDYQSGVPKIPTACITVEDAEMMGRMASRGTKIVIRLKMGAKTFPDADSFNTVAEIVGSKYPEQVVLLSGHLDSWDVGQGAMDDGGGAFISWEALSLLKDLGLRPKRTLRLVLWTGEEQGGVGASQYYELHKINISNFDVVMESDIGTFMPLGIQFTGNDKARGIMREIMKLLKPINITNLYKPAEGTDIEYWMQAGVPGASLLDDFSKYFWFHHSQGDTMAVQDPRTMNLCAAVWTVVSYVIADMEEMLPR